jgi:hypothetical protein
MEALQELRQTLIVLSEKCPKCKGRDYAGGKCRDCKFNKRDAMKVDARAILRQRGLL